MHGDNNEAHSTQWGCDMSLTWSMRLLPRRRILGTETAQGPCIDYLSPSTFVLEVRQFFIGTCETVKKASLSDLALFWDALGRLDFWTSLSTCNTYLYL
jgi:hypothetical protein